MDKILIGFTNMIETSYEVALIVLAVLVVRWVLNWIRVPRKYVCLLWIIPFLRMIVPFQMESEFSLMPEEPPAVIIEMKETADTFEKTGIGDMISEEITSYGESLSNQAEAEAVPMIQEKKEGSDNISEWILPVSAIIWLAGIGVMLIYSIASYVRFRIGLSTAVRMNGTENIYLADNIDSPFVLCGRKSIIYLPSDMKESMKEYVIAHELEHIRRKDPIVKLIAYGISLVHWMNPFTWAAYYFLGRDMEIACDEAVIQNQDGAYRKEYAKTLLFLSVGKVNFNGVPLAFAEGNPKDRVEKIAAYKKPAFWAAAVGIVCVAVLAVGCLSNPKGQIDLEGIGKVDDGSGKAPESFFEGEGTYAKAAKINLKASTGFDGSKLYYVDEEHIIFGGYYGVFVFSKEKAKIVASVDLAELGWDEGCEVKTSPDGRYIYFSLATGDVVYGYDWATIKMYPLTKSWDELKGFELLVDEKGSHFVQDGKKIYFQLREGQSQMIGDLMYREYTLHEETRELLSDKYRHLFLEGKYRNPDAFEPEDLVPLVKAEMVIQGELLTVTDEKILHWMEEHLSRAEEIKGGTGCPFYNPLYLTRKDGNVGVIYPATDSCSAFRTENGNYYDYTPGYEDNSEFWSYLEGWLEGMYPDTYGRLKEEQRGDSLAEDAEYVDGTWIYKGKSYRYRLEVTGRLKNAVKDMTYVIVTNDKDITFDELFPLSGLSSSLDAGARLRENTALIRIETAE